MTSLNNSFILIQIDKLTGGWGPVYYNTRTVKVQHAVVVLVSVLEQLIDLVLCDLLTGAADDRGELLSVDVTVSVPTHKTQGRR